MKSYSWEGNLTNVVPIGLTPLGLRLDASFTAKITSGDLQGADLSGIDYLLLRHDGVGVVDARETITMGNAPGVHAHAMGYIVPPFDMPPLEAILDPDFAWPDADLPMHGAVLLESHEPKSALNRTVYAWTGQVNVGAGTVGITAQAIA